MRDVGPGDRWRERYLGKRNVVRLIATSQLFGYNQSMRCFGAGKYRGWIWVARSSLMAGGLMVALASCANTSTKITGDSLIEFDHSSRTFQEPRGR
jgi:hypothetical protein